MKIGPSKTIDRRSLSDQAAPVDFASGGLNEYRARRDEVSCAPRV
jgi:hypothetical protein